MTFKYIPTFLFALCLCLCPFFAPLEAQTAAPAVESAEGVPGNPNPSIVTKMSALVAISLLPFAVMLLTSFTKIIVVLSLLRSALGIQQTPPNQVLSGIAFILSIYVMFPTCLAMYTAAQGIQRAPPTTDLMSGDSALYVLEVMDKTKEPLRDFLQKNSMTRHVKSFYQLAHRVFPEPFKSMLQSSDFIILVPSFILGQLQSAFEVGVMIYLPFFVIDLVVSNILLAMGMMMLSPLTIALPIKLLLLVMIDGWTVILQGLVLTFR